MKYLFFLLFLLCQLGCQAALCQTAPVSGRDSSSTRIPYDRIEPHLNFAPHYYPCRPGNKEFPCGSNPPTFVATPAQCGWALSTGGARNADGSPSTNGMRIVLPTAAALRAAGYVDANAACQINIIETNSATQFVRIAMSDPDGKFTPLYQQAWDMREGEVILANEPSGSISFIFNGTSWLAEAGTPNMMEQLGFGQMAASGQGTLFLVTSDFPGNTVGSLVGNLAFCAAGGGNGIIVNDDGGWMLDHIPHNCVFLPPSAGAATNWIELRNAVSGVVDEIYPGASNGVGGHYVVVEEATFLGFQSGDTVCVQNIVSLHGTKANGCWIGKRIASGASPCAAGHACVELHEHVFPTGVKEPSSFVAGDRLDHSVKSAPGTSFMYMTESSGKTAHVSNPAFGQEMVDTAIKGTLVGLVQRVAGNYVDVAKNRLVASLYNPVQKHCIGKLSADRTTTSTSFVEVGSEMRCGFVYLSRTTSRQKALGNTGNSAVTFAVNGEASNDTARDGCEFAVGFDGVAAEAEQTGFTNPAGISGGRYPVSIAGSRAAPLAEAGHYVTLLARAVNGGTCTFHAAATTLQATIWQ